MALKELLQSIEIEGQNQDTKEQPEQPILYKFGKKSAPLDIVAETLEPETPLSSLNSSKHNSALKNAETNANKSIEKINSGLLASDETAKFTEGNKVFGKKDHFGTAIINVAVKSPEIREANKN